MVRTQRLVEQLHVQQIRDQIVARVREVIDDLDIEIRLEPFKIGAALGRFDVDRFEGVVDEPSEQLVVLRGQSEHAANDVGGNVLRVLRGRVDQPRTALGGRGQRFIEPLPAQRPDLVFPWLDDLGRKRRQQQAAGVMVERRVARDRRSAADRRLQEVFGTRPADDDGPAREVVGVVRDLRHKFVGQRRPHSAVPIGVGHWAPAVDDLAPDRWCVSVVGGISVVEVRGPVRDGAVGARRHDDSLASLAHACASIEMAYSGQFATARCALSSRSGVTVPSPMTTAWPKSSTSNSSGARA